MFQNMYMTEEGKPITTGLTVDGSQIFHENLE